MFFRFSDVCWNIGVLWKETRHEANLSELEREQNNLVLVVQCVFVWGKRNGVVTTWGGSKFGLHQFPIQSSMTQSCFTPSWRPKILTRNLGIILQCILNLFLLVLLHNIVFHDGITLWPFTPSINMHFCQLHHKRTMLNTGVNGVYNLSNFNNFQR